MFRTAATKLAHNSTLPVLGANKDLRPLQDLITAEKSVLQSYQRISSDLLRSNECLRHWGAGEGEDLQDILAACTALMNSMASAFSQYARHEQTIREYMKAVRTQEEYLDELRKRRKNILSRADAAERKLSKMAPDHKNMLPQTELLNNLREQIRNLDWEIQLQESKLGDLKRTNTKNWMALKFGGLLECAEKATIVGDIGKLMIEEIPITTTQPGQPRIYYTGHEKTQKLLSEAQRCLSEVVFDPQPVSPASNPGQSAATFSNALGSRSNLSNKRSDGSLRGSAVPGLGADEFGGLEDSYGPRTYGSMPIANGSKYAGDGIRRHSSEQETPVNNSSGSASSAIRFGTFPVRKSSLSAEVVAPQPLPISQSISLQPLQETSSTSFADEIASALAYGGEDEKSSMSPTRHASIQTSLPSYNRHELDTPVPSVLPISESRSYDGRYYAQNDGPGSPRVPDIVRKPPQAHEDVRYDDSDSEIQSRYASPPQIPQPSLPQASDELRNPTEGSQTEQMPEAGLQPPNSKVNEFFVSPYKRNEQNEQEVRAAAAREVARELDALSFSPPVNTPSESISHVLEPNTHYEPLASPPPRYPMDRPASPLMPPAPPFAQQAGSPLPISNLSVKLDGAFAGSRGGFGASPAGYDSLSHQETSTAPPSPTITAQARSRPTTELTSASPSLSIQAATTPLPYTMPVDTMPSPSFSRPLPLRSGSPLSVGSRPPPPTGARTISAAAFKRPQARSPSGSGAGASGQDSRLPDVTPLLVRKRSPSSVPGSDMGTGTDLSQQRPSTPDDEQTYEFVSPQPPPSQSSANYGHGASSGYAIGKFSTNLEEENRR